MQKKQIVFIEPKATVTMLRLARSLRLSGKYEMILVCFSKVNRELFERAYDKILVMELSHKFRFKSLFSLSKKMLGKEVRNFFKKIAEMNPYIFQITGPDLFSLITLNYLRKNPCPKIYYSNDLWSADKRNFFFTKNFWIKGEFQKFCERRCFKQINGIINKKSLEEFDILDYKINVPKMALPLSCLDEWTFSPKKKKGEIHIVFSSSPAHPLFKGEVPFMEILRTITSQKIHFHTYGPCINEKHNQEFVKESKRNKYYHFHDFIKPDLLNKEMSGYDYGIFLSFMEPSKTDLFVMLEKELNAKMMNYLESGLPMIINGQYKYMTRIIEEREIGFAIDFENLKNLGKILEKTDYKNLQKNVKKFQEASRASKKIKDVEEFYEKIAGIVEN